MERLCKWCEEPLVKRPGEAPNKFKKRNYCNQQHGALASAQWRPKKKLGMAWPPTWRID